MITLTELQRKLNNIVLGQEEAVKIISVTLYKYLMKLYARDYGLDFGSSTSLMLMGNTGVGKTYLARNMAEFLDIPFIEINSKTLNQDGAWSGKSFVDIVKNQLWSGRKGVIIFIDEFDKILCSNVSSGGDDVNYHVQCSLLKYIEGFEIRESPDKLTPSFNLHTKNCMFILAGAFVGLEVQPAKKIGFYSNNNILAPELHDALIKFGMIPELAGRIQNIAQLKDLTEEEYCNILNSEYFIYNKYKEVLKRMGIVEKMETSVILKEVIKKNLGVRGLIQEVEKYISSVILENELFMDLDKLTGVYDQPASNKLENKK